MNKLFKTFLLVIFILILCSLAIFFFIQSGFIVKPTPQSLSQMIEIPHYDIFTHQLDREQEILADYNASIYTFSDPYVILNPYEMNPLSALVIYESTPGLVTVTVKGDTPADTLTYERKVEFQAEVPILGLYPGRTNKVTLKSDTGETTALDIDTEYLPADFQTYELISSDPVRMEPGFTLFIACFDHSYNAVLDSSGQVRAYLSNTDMAHGTSMILLENGNMLSTGDEMKQQPYNMTSLWEYNWLGKVFREYEIPNAIHHNVSELPNGDFLAVSNNRNMFQSGTREDVAIIISRETGEVITEYDFRQIIDETRSPYHQFHPAIVNPQNIDWMHMNAAIEDPSHNAIIVSSPTQSQVVCIDKDSKEINWILGPHEGYEGSAEFLKQYLLTPVGSDFEWQWCQHEPMILPDADNNPDTINILLFDNGQSRSFTEANSISAEENYSRGVIFRINYKNKTVEQIWEYGKERGSELYATFLGDADYLPQTGNRIIAFGGQIRTDGKPTDDILGGVMSQVVINSRIVEVTEEKDIVFEVAVHENPYTTSAETYQVERLLLYSPDSFSYHLGDIIGQRCGTPYFSPQTDEIKPPSLYTGELGINFHRIYNEGGRLVAQGDITYNRKSYLLGRAFFILRSANNVYVYATNSGLNGMFFLSLDTSELVPGEYQISIMGVAREGNDQLNGKFLQGHAKTEYKITIEP